MATRAERAAKAHEARENKAYRKQREQDTFNRMFKAAEAAGPGRYAVFSRTVFGADMLRAVRREAYKRRGLHGDLVYATRVVGDWEALEITCTVGV